jgi:hypothetical protein
MDSPNRINQVSITQTTQRQTPENDFGQVLARTVGQAVHTGAAVAGGLAMGTPVVSAAVGSVARAASAVTQVGSASPGQTSGPAASDGTTGKGEDWDLLEAQKLMRSEERKFNMEYLALQNGMQRESREFTAVSNIMKVRHDSAKAAINNIR